MPTPYVLGMAERLSEDLANCGLVIISGMARGIDSIAHKGAIQARGRTIAVFGTGVDIIYPRENRKLSEQILELGGPWSVNFRSAPAPIPTIYRCATASSAASRAEFSWSKPENSAAPASPVAAPWSRAGKSSPSPAM